jgi:glutamyl-tRNA reductase
MASLDAEERQAVEAMTRGMMNKLLHGPLTALKAAARDGDFEAMEAIRAAFTGDRKSGQGGGE